MRRMMACALTALMLLGTALPAYAESDAEPPQGPMPQHKYVGVADQNVAIRAERSREADAVGQLQKGDRVYVLSYEPGWLLVVQGSDERWVTGYVLRHTVFDVTAAEEGITPYGATPAAYRCVIARDTNLYATPDKKGELLGLLTEGTRVAVLSIEDGWAQVIDWRQYGYFYLDAATDLVPVYDIESARSGDTIAAFVSFYNLSDKGLNPNRIVNIHVSCEYISRTIEPGEDFSFNGIAGPYSPSRGYYEAPAFVDGETVASFGGGTCQVSSTLYNVLLPLKGDINITYRVAHGPSGAAYLPHGVDAACGSSTIDLRFRNEFSFPVRIEASAQDGVLFIAMAKE